MVDICLLANNISDIGEKPQNKFSCNLCEQRKSGRNPVSRMQKRDKFFGALQNKI